MINYFSFHFKSMSTFTSDMEHIYYDINCQLIAYSNVYKAWSNLGKAYENMFITCEREDIDEMSYNLYGILSDVHYLKIAILQAINIIKTYEGITDDERLFEYDNLKNKISDYSSFDNMLDETHDLLINIFNKPLNELDINKLAEELDVEPEEI